MLALIHKHCGDKLSVKEIAASAFISERECFRVFRDCLNTVSYTHLDVYKRQALMSVEAPYDFLLMNQEGLRLFRCQEGASNEAMKGKSLRDVIHPEDYENLVQLFKDTAEMCIRDRLLLGLLHAITRGSSMTAR